MYQPKRLFGHLFLLHRKRIYEIVSNVLKDLTKSSLPFFLFSCREQNIIKYQPVAGRIGMQI